MGKLITLIVGLLIGSGGYLVYLGQTQTRLNIASVHETIRVSTTPSVTTVPIPSISNGNISATPTWIPTPQPSTTQPKFTKDSYKIAILGDSMIDTMGETMNPLSRELAVQYPSLKFNLYNYSMGATTVYQRLDGFGSSFDYKTRHFPPLSDLRPDIIVVASFAYNPRYPFVRDEHWLGLAGLIDKALNITENVYVLAEIAPLSYDFGRGAGETAGWSDTQRFNHAKVIVDQLENAIGLGAAKGISVINAYYPTKTAGAFGGKVYTNSSDGIHPSAAGHALMARLIATTIEGSLY
jgi:hypothetical protein